MNGITQIPGRFLETGVLPLDRLDDTFGAPLHNRLAIVIQRTWHVCCRPAVEIHADDALAELMGLFDLPIDPRAGVTLWQKMGAASKGAPPQWLSTHPSGKTRIADIQANLPKVMPLYERARAR